MISLNPFCFASKANDKAPLMGRSVPSNDNSPNIILPSGLKPVCFEAIKKANAIGKSYSEPSFFKSAGARFTSTLKVRAWGERSLELFMAASTLSSASLMALSGSPTIEKDRSPCDTSISTSTSLASSPIIAAEKTLLGMKILINSIYCNRLK